MKDQNKLLMTFVIGAAVGAALTYLLSSDEGKEIVDDLKKRGKKIRDDLDAELEKGKDIFNDIRETAESML